MARYAYDVNTTQRLIDVHKQFQGGLKTVDTDDSLGAVFLRDGQNVSLSEFGFIEKRYGTYENFKKQTSAVNLQGFWEYMPEDTLYTIYAADGNLYVDNVKVNFFYKENKDWRYPLDAYTASPENVECTTNSLDGNYIVYSPTTQDPSQTAPQCDTQRITYYNQCSPVSGTGSSQWRCVLKELIPEIPYEANFQTTRDVNAIEIKNVLYIFNGTYPVYAKEVDGELKFFMFSVDIPTYAEYVVVNNNLLEDNYNELYFEDFVNIGKNQATLEEPETFSEGPVVKQIKQSSFPKFPYAVDDEDPNFNGLMTFKSSFKYIPQLLSEYPTGDYYRLNVVSSAYRNSGVGASDFDFITINPNDVSFPKISNLSTGNSYNVTGKFVEPQNKIVDKVAFDSALSEVIATKNINYQATNFPFAKTKVSVIQDFTPEFLEENKDKSVYFSLIHQTNNIDGDLVRYNLEELSLEDQGFSLGTGELPVDEILLNDSANFYLQEGGHSIGERYFDIVPYRVFDGERIYFDEQIIKVQANLLEKNYALVIPSLANVSDNVEGYEVRFVAVILTLDDRSSDIWGNVFYDGVNEEPKFNFSTKVLTTYPAIYTHDLPEAGQQVITQNVVWAKDIGLIEPLEITEKNFTNSFEVTLKNLIAGTYDFKFRIGISRYVLSDNFLKIEETNFVDFLFYNKSITIEKIQDYPGLENVPVIPKAVYTCNRVMEHFNKLMIWGSKEMPNSVFYSFPDRPTYFPQNFYLNFGDDKRDPVEAVTPYMNILVVQTPNTTWGVRGNSGLLDSPAPYVPFTINTTVGTIAYKSVRPVRNHLFFLSKQGMIALKSLYAADEQYNIEFVDRNIRNIVPQDTQAVGIQYDNQYWLNFPNFGITLRWYIDKKAWVKDVFAWGDAFKGVFKWQNINGKLEFITYPNTLQDDVNNHIYKIGIDESLPSDMGDIIVSKFETSFLNQNYPFHIKNYKEFKYDFTMQNEYNFSRDPIFLKKITVENNDETTLNGVGLKKNHFYMLSFFEPTSLFGVTVGTTPVSIEGFEGSTILEGFTDYIFKIPNSIDGLQNITIFFSEHINYAAEISIKDVTYDESMTFLSKIISEERNILNQQLPIGYEEEQKELIINLEDFKDFTLGSSYFGDRVTFVKTIKLSGKGYNTKAYFEDLSKSKWTIESMGITYKMKKARSR
jgi:hypothetical protein